MATTIKNRGRVRNRVILFLCSCIVYATAFAQIASNKGKEFWVGYGHHQYMEFTNDNSQNMVIYISTDDKAANVSISIERFKTITGVPTNTSSATYWKRNYSIPPNSVISTGNNAANSFTPASTLAIGPMPKKPSATMGGAGTTDNYDARLWDGPAPLGNGGSGMFLNKAIHIVSDVPIVAYAHIYGGVSSGATMLLPVETWGYSYTTLNSSQGDAANSFNFFYVIAKENGTVVEITPSQNSRAGFNKIPGYQWPANTPFQITLNKGDIYQYVGDANAAGYGVDLTGSKIKSISAGAGDCKPIAVVAGSSRTIGETGSCGTSSGRDNDMQQCFPEHTWGKRYLTTPFSIANGGLNTATLIANTFMTSVYKIAVKDPTTVVKRNGIQIPLGSLIGGKYYKYSSNTADYIESDKPIMIAQYMLSGACDPGGLGDPEMLYLSPMEQAIKQVGFFRNNVEAIYANYVTLVVPDAGLASLKIDNSPVATSSLTAISPAGGNALHIYSHPNKPGYKVVVRGWNSAQLPVLIKCDSAFNAITYGLGNAESYAFSAGAQLKNLSTIEAFHNLPDTSGILTTHPYTYVGTPTQLGAYLSYIPIQMEWHLDSIASVVSPNSPVTYSMPIIFTATAINAGSAPSYQWKVNGSNVGTNSPTYTSSSFVNSDAVTCVVTSNDPCASPATATSNSTSVTLNSTVTPSVTISSSTTSICSGNSITFTAVPTNGGTAPTYQWKVNTVDVPGAIASTFVTSTLVSGDKVTCEMTSNAALVTSKTALSNIITMTSTNTDVPAISINYSASSVCTGNSPITFIAHPINGGSSPTYQWQVDNVNTGTNSNVFTSTILANNSVVKCIMTSNAACLTAPIATSNVVTITNGTITPTINISVDTIAVCLGRSATFTAITNNAGLAPSYQWQVNGGNVGTNSNTFSSNTLVSGAVVTCILTSNASCITPTTPITSNSITMTQGGNVAPSVTITSSTNSLLYGFYIDTVRIGGAIYYLYRLPGQYVFNTPGTYYMPIDLTSPTADNGNCKNKETGFIEIIVKPKPTSLFTYNPTVGCGLDTVRFFSNATTIETYKIIKWKWQFTSAPSDTSSKQNPGFYFSAPGIYPVKLSITTLYGGIADTIINVTVTAGTQPHSTFTAIPTTVCLGEKVTFTPTSTTSGTTGWWWDFQDGNTPSTRTTNASIDIIYATTGTHYVKHTITGTGFSCLADTVVTPIIVALTPNITNRNVLAPTTCGGTDGGIELIGLAANATYTVNYLFNGSPQVATITANATGIVTILNLATGIYSNITVKIGNCTSNSVGPLTVSNPAAPAAPTVSSNTPVCEGGQINLTATPVITGATYAWTGPNGFTSGLSSPTISNAPTANSGVYNVTVTVNGCTSAAVPTTVQVNAKPIISVANGINPTACATATGSITLSTLLPSTSYSVSYTNASGTQTQTITSNAIGEVVISNLSSGNYTNIIVVLGSCTSAPAGPVVLLDPNPPATPTAIVLTTPICAGATLNFSAVSSTAGVSFEWTGPNSYTVNGATPALTNATTAATGNYTVVAKLNGCTSAISNAVSVVVNAIPATPSASSNSPICAGSNLNLVSSGVTGTAIYNWTGPNGFVNNVDANPTITNATTAATGAYSLTVTQNGCTSAASAPVNVTVNAVPAISNPVLTSATTCATATGSITLDGLVASTTYSVSYTAGATPQTVSIVSASNGSLTIPNLTAGSYSTIFVTLNNCQSNTIAGPFTITDPTPPATPTATVLVTPICAGGTLNFSAVSSTAGVSFEWTGPNSYTATGATPSLASATTAATGNYTVVAKLNGCTSAVSNAVSVVVNAIPATPTIASNSPICAGSSLNLTSANVTGAATYSWTGPNSYTNTVDANPTIANATTAATGSYTLTVTQNGCPSPVSLPLNVTVNVVPSINTPVLTNTTTCATATGTITLSGLIASTSYTVNYIFGSTPQTATIVAGTGGSLVIPNLVAGTYSNISVTSNNCTSNVIAGPFTITDPNPPAKPSIASNNSPVCSGTAIVLTASSALSGVTYTWTTPSGATVTGSTLTLNNSTSADAGNYAVTVTLNSCVSSPEIAGVIVKPTPTATGTSANPTTCATATGSITLNGLTAGTAYTVNYTKNSAPQTATITANASGAVIIPNLTAATYASVTLTLNGCTSTAVGPFVLSDPNPPATPSIAALPATTICTGNNLTLTASTATTGNIIYTWTSSNGFTSTGTNPVIQFNNATTGIAGTYSVTATLNSCVSAATPITIVVNTTPAITATFTNPTDCNSATGTILLNGLVANTAYTVNYTKNTTAETATLTSNALGLVTIPALSAATYSNISVVLNACPSNVVGPFTLTDPSAPGVTITTNNSPICETGTVNVVATSSATGVAFAWTSTNGYASTGNNIVNIANAPTSASGTYTVTAIRNSCTSTATALVQVNPNPVASFTPPPFVCMPNGVANFTNTSTVIGNGSMTYTWDFGDATPLTTTVNGSHTYASIGNYPVKLTATSNGCSTPVTTSFSAFYDKPVAAFKIDKDTVCQGVPNVFTDLSTAPNSTITNWSWNFGDGSLPSISSSPTKLYTLPGDFDVTLTVKNAQGCSSDITPKKIKVYLQPKIDAGPSFIVPQGTTVVFNPTTNDSTTVTFLWTPAADFAHPDSLRPKLVVLKNQKYRVTATGQGQCTAWDTLSVVALKTLDIPNAFSPNGDGINDKWEIGNLIDYSFANVEVFNRNGQSVFKSYAGYSRPWDGTFKGKTLPVGTYYYIIDFRNVFPTKSGYVVILK